MSEDNLDKEYISYDENIFTLVKRGILPEWIAIDADRHGMSEAENILCEWDWEWGWDLGDGYSHEQAEILKSVRERIKKGIENFESNPELVAKRKAERLAKKIRAAKFSEYKKKYAYQYAEPEDIKWLVDFEEKKGSLPYLFMVCHKSLLPNRSNIQKAQLLRIGVSCDMPMSPEEVQVLFPDFDLKKLKDLPYKTWTLIQSYREVVDKMLEGMPEVLPDPADDSWQNLIEAQKLAQFGMTPSRLYRLITFFRLNDLSPAKRKKLSAGIY